MAIKVSHFDFDWWIVQKRAVQVVALILALCAVAAAAGLYVWKYGNPLRRVAMLNEVTPGARFISFEGDVRVIRAATREVVAASSDTQLYAGDTVQTQADGRARINMADGSTVVVRPNSTIIIRDNAAGEDGKRSNVHVVVDSGQMLVRTPQQSDDSKNVVETPKMQNQIASQTAASFGVNPEGTEEIRVNTGSVESVNRSGERATLHGGEYVRVNQSGTISKPQRLLDAPQPAQPQRSTQLQHRRASGIELCLTRIGCFSSATSLPATRESREASKTVNGGASIFRMKPLVPCSSVSGHSTTIMLSPTWPTMSTSRLALQSSSSN